MQILESLKNVIGISHGRGGGLDSVIKKSSIPSVERILFYYKGPEGLPFETKVKSAAMSIFLRSKTLRRTKELGCSILEVSSVEELVWRGNQLLASKSRFQVRDSKMVSGLVVIDALKKIGCIPASKGKNIVLILPWNVHGAISEAG